MNLRGLFFILLFPFLPLIAQEPPSCNMKYYTENFPPHNFLENGQLKGITIDLLEIIWARMGCALTRKDIEMVPWARGYKTVLNTPNSMLFGMGRNQKREKLFKWIGPYYQKHKLVLIARKERKIALRNLLEAQKYSIGVVRADFGAQFLKNHSYIASQLDYSADRSTLIRKLHKGRVDLACIISSNAYKDFTKLGIDHSKYEEVLILDQSGSYFGVNIETSDEIIKQYQTILMELVKDGTVERLFQKYNSQLSPQK